MATENEPTAKLPKDEVYYWNTAVFQVENRRFRLPLYHLLKGSQHFAKICGLEEEVDSGLELGELDGEGCSGSKREQVIKLDADVDDFRNFVKVIFPTSFANAPDLTKAQWISVLKLATCWHFKEARQIAIEHLDDFPLTSIEHIQLGKQYYVPGWLLHGYENLVRQEDPISLEDARAIGLESAIRLYIVRTQIDKYRRDEDFLERSFAEEISTLSEREWELMTDAEMERRSTQTGPKTAAKKWREEEAKRSTRRQKGKERARDEGHGGDEWTAADFDDGCDRPRLEGVRLSRGEAQRIHRNEDDSQDKYIKDLEREVCVATRMMMMEREKKHEAMWRCMKYDEHNKILSRRVEILTGRIDLKRPKQSGKRSHASISENKALHSGSGRENHAQRRRLDEEGCT
ncbi:hypothetical protein CC1G_04677 [Coprinopsis cinerea okayama7|uniref:BTB domain-containing protein n=1 Tax=Coprinopsis cinerea (strain Okayama-7 / 130 / ATCC MYA-4618 / FGSC 9003) TaxID=240176 RepID=A8N4X7_COPC7|nr:hypothetical protein CC1G_04677 [Coprinopsis cinerea okayama7\|eukprot:XP_001829988.2 hypothetical protein CC1G_04677 [Coprinopsis cinerea okayama7\